MRPYKASGSISGGGFILLLILGVIAGAAMGGVLWAVDNYLHFYLILLFPIIAGAIAGGLLARAVKTSKVRSPFLAGLSGVVAALVMFGVYHFATYFVTFRNEVRNIIVEAGNPTPTDAELDQVIDDELERQVGDRGLIGYMKLAAEEGITITRTVTTSTEKGMDLTGTGVWVYWAAEVLFAAWIAAAMAWGAAKEPFDENAGEWYQPPSTFAVATKKSRKALLNALKDGNFQEAGALLTTEAIKYPRVELATRRSPDAASQDIVLIVNDAQRQNRVTKAKTGVVSPSELELIKRGMQQAAAQPPNPLIR